MSMWRRAQRPTAPEARSTVALPPYFWGASSVGTFASVDTSSATAPLQSVAAGATIDLICSLTRGLPVGVFSGTGKDRRKRPVPGYLEDPTGDGHGLGDWIYQALASYLLRGNLFANVAARGPGGVPQQAIILPPDSVHPQESGGGGVDWFVKGRLFPAADMWHTRVNPLPGCLLGESPIARKARTLGVSLRAAAFGDQWFTDGAHPSGMLKNSEAEIDATQAQTVKDRFMATLFGSREPVVMGKGWEWEQLQVNPEESQFLQTMGWSEAQCARIFGPGYAEVLGYESGGSLTYATVEGRTTHLLVFSMNRWLTCVEDLLTAMLPKPQYAKLNRAALLETTVIERYRAHELALRNGWKTPDEVREVEELPPLPNGLGAVPNKPAAPAAPASTQEGGTDA